MMIHQFDENVICDPPPFLNLMAEVLNEFITLFSHIICRVIGLDAV